MLSVSSVGDPMSSGVAQQEACPFSEELAAQVRAIAARYPRAATAGVESLLAVQQRKGWVSDPCLAGVAGLLGMSAAELDSIATFYSRIFRRPVGRHVLSVCDSVSCWLLGGETLLGWLERRLGIRCGETTPDGLFTLLPTVCLGHCEDAPAMLVDARVFRRLDEEQLERLLAELARRPDRLEAEE